MNKRRATWFATLRRDRGLFALLAVLLLMIQAVQPLAAAGAADAGGMPIICTALPADDGSKPSGALNHESCAKCIASACGFSPVGKVLAQALPAWLAPQNLAELSQPTDRLIPPPGAVAERPPAIRAPPTEI